MEVDCISEPYPDDLAEPLVTKDDNVRGGNSDQLSLSTDEDEDKRMHPEKKRSKTDLP